MSAKVSFIVILYNGEKYAEQCARSLFEQTLEDIEIVFVNDASTDNTEAVILQTLEDYPKRKLLLFSIIANALSWGLYELALSFLF